MMRRTHWHGRFRRDRRHLVRLVVAGTALFGWLACADTGCDCVAPLDQPMAEEYKVYDAVQARVTPGAIAFIEENLAGILPAMLGEQGLEFEIPTTNETFGIIDVEICPTPCSLSAEIVSADLSQTPPNQIGLDAVANVTGELRLDAGIVADCRVPVHMQNKQITANVNLYIDALDHLLFIDVADFSVTVTENDFTLDCGGLFGWLVEALKDTITDMMNDEIAGQLDGVIDDMLNDMFCTNCDFYASGCPEGSTCGGDFCMQNDVCRVKPLGLVGKLDLGELLGDVGAGLQAEMDVFAAVGQMQNETADPMLVADGLELRLIGGAYTKPHMCVPEPDPGQIPPTDPPVRLALGDTVPGSDLPFMAGIGISDAFLDWVIYQVYQSGLLCLKLGTETTDLLNSGTLSLLGMASLNTLTAGRAVPVKLQLKPSQLPVIEIGAGTFTDDGSGNQVIDEPLLYLDLKGMGLDFYVLLDERWTRVLSVSVDLGLELALTITPDNFLVPLIDQDSVLLENIAVTNYELLAEDPEDLANLLPTLLEIAVPMLTDMIGQIEIPPIDPFTLEIVAMQGEMPRAETPYHDYLALYADLAIVEAKFSSRDTRAFLVDSRVPPLEHMSIKNDSPEYPTVVFEAAADPGAPAEFSWRLDRGLWSPFGKGPRFSVRDPRLLLVGRHTLEVRSRTAGDYRSLDPTPASFEFDIRPPDRAEFSRPETLSPAEPGRPQAWSSHQQPVNAVSETTGGGGCACGTRPAGGSAVLLVLGLLVVGYIRRIQR